MDVYSTEEQQLEAIKNWFKKNANFISWVVIIFSVIFMGYQYYSHHKSVTFDNASEKYFTMLQSFSANDNESGATQAKSLISEYPKTAYANLANLILASHNVNNQEFAKAEENLLTVINNSKERDEIQAIALVRLMRLYRQTENNQAAFDLYDKYQSKIAKALLSSLTEIKADILLAENKISEAKLAYQAAKDQVIDNDLASSLLDYKFNELNFMDKI